MCRDNTSQENDRSIFYTVSWTGMGNRRQLEAMKTISQKVWVKKLEKMISLKENNPTTKNSKKTLIKNDTVEHWLGEKSP